jgi:hypothetical protein
VAQRNHLLKAKKGNTDMLKQTLFDRGQLINRLTAQVGSKAKAISILQKRGHLAADGKTLTEEGQKRNEMTASERAIDRAVKITGKPGNYFYYDQFKNNAKLFNK